MARRPALWVPERGEIIFIEHSPYVGKAMPGLHPTLACSTAAFAGKAGVVIGFAMSASRWRLPSSTPTIRLRWRSKGRRTRWVMCLPSSRSLSTGVRATHVPTPGARGTTRCLPLRSRNWTPPVAPAITEPAAAQNESRGTDSFQPLHAAHIPNAPALPGNGYPL